MKCREKVYCLINIYRFPLYRIYELILKLCKHCHHERDGAGQLHAVQTCQRRSLPRPSLSDKQIGRNGVPDQRTISARAVGLYLEWTFGIRLGKWTFELFKISR